VHGRLKSARTAATAAIGALFLNFPLLGLADTDSTIAGVPTLYAYLFCVWALVIVLVALAIHLSR
jgi:hypothetical protein